MYDIYNERLPNFEDNNLYFEKKKKGGECIAFGSELIPNINPRMFEIVSISNFTVLPVL